MSTTFSCHDIRVPLHSTSRVWTLLLSPENFPLFLHFVCGLLSTLVYAVWEGCAPQSCVSALWHSDVNTREQIYIRHPCINLVRAQRVVPILLQMLIIPTQYRIRTPWEFKNFSSSFSLSFSFSASFALQIHSYYIYIYMYIYNIVSDCVCITCWGIIYRMHWIVSRPCLFRQPRLCAYNYECLYFNVSVLDLHI